MIPNLQLEKDKSREREAGPILTAHEHEQTYIESFVP